MNYISIREERQVVTFVSLVCLRIESTVEHEGDLHLLIEEMQEALDQHNPHLMLALKMKVFGGYPQQFFIAVNQRVHRWKQSQQLSAGKENGIMQEDLFMKTIKTVLKAFLLYFLAIHCLLFLAIQANADAMTGVPETGKPETHSSLTIDHSHASDGYIIVKAPKSSRSLKIAISFDGTAKIHYNLNTNGDEEILPLQYGSGKYAVSLYHQISGSKYQKDGEVSFTIKMKDKLGYTLYPNQWVKYTAETTAVQYADELCADLTDEYEITMAIYQFMGKNFSYDWLKSGDVKAGTLKDILPDIDGSWETRTGICQDMAAIMCAMLRSQGIHAQLVIGTCSGTPHAWVTVYYHSVDGNLKSLSLDPTYRCNATAKAGYKAERYY